MSEPNTHNYRTFYCSKCGYPLTVAIHCGDRFCSICNTSRFRRVRRRLTHLFDRIRPHRPYALRFITLTIPNADDATDGVKHCVDSFRRLRQTRLWKQLVHGGAYVIEVTMGKEGWHPHIHAIIESKYFPVRQLSRLWERSSTGRIVWIERVGPGRHLIGYLTKYITKCAVPNQHRAELSRALKGSHLFQTFGTWHKVNMQCPPSSPCCPRCGNDEWVFIPHKHAPDRDFVVLNGGPDPP